MTTVNTIKVVCPDRMCFRVRASDLEPLACSTYDAWAFTDPEPGQISLGEWNLRRDAQRQREMHNAGQTGRGEL